MKYKNKLKGNKKNKFIKNLNFQPNGVIVKIWNNTIFSSFLKADKTVFS